MKLLVLLVLVGGVFAKKSCPPNSSYHPCGTSCPLTCDNFQRSRKACIQKCNPGCHCDEGYVLREDGWCVPPEYCPRGQGTYEVKIECGDSERYNECGSACPPTCDSLFEPPKACPAICVEGCECIDGYVRNSEGRCVLPARCPLPPLCGDNERYNECGSACPPTCDSISVSAKACTEVCVKGCECIEGYVRNSEGRCVLPAQCPFPVLCGENEEYMKCGSACPPTCDSILEPSRMCPAVCIQECQCVKGFVRSRDGRCIRPEECFKTSVSDSCGDEQVDTCQSIYKNCCPIICI